MKLLMVITLLSYGCIGCCHVAINNHQASELLEEKALVNKLQRGMKRNEVEEILQVLPLKVFGLVQMDISGINFSTYSLTTDISLGLEFDGNDELVSPPDSLLIGVEGGLWHRDRVQKIMLSEIR